MRPVVLSCACQRQASGSVCPFWPHIAVSLLRFPCRLSREGQPIRTRRRESLGFELVSTFREHAQTSSALMSHTPLCHTPLCVTPPPRVRRSRASDAMLSPQVSGVTWTTRVSTTRATAATRLRWTDAASATVRPASPASTATRTSTSAKKVRVAFTARVHTGHCDFALKHLAHQGRTTLTG